MIARNLPAVAWIAALGALGCAAPAPEVRTFGTMREVLREGNVEGRIAVLDAVGPDSIAVGALASLEGEITVLGGKALVAVGATGELRAASPDDQAALLVVADVPTWRAVALVGSTADLDSLESAVAAALEAEGFDLTSPVPVRIRGHAKYVRCHVIAGACPIAQPDGPPPRRVERNDFAVELVGVHAEGRAGELTHHTNRSHLHAVGAGIMGHLEAIDLSDAVLLVPNVR